jgi:hypothetical protein
VDLAYAIGKGTSTPQIGHDKYAWGYEEKVPITISAIDKTGISGDSIMWKGEHALRYALETYPLGSLRTLETGREKTERLGSTTLYSVECTLNYRRNVT